MTPNAHAALRSAVLALCADQGLVARLERAHGALRLIDPAHELPTELRFRFEELVADIAYGATSVSEALVRMSAPDRERLAQRIVTLFGDAARLAPLE